MRFKLYKIKQIVYEELPALHATTKMKLEKCSKIQKTGLQYFRRISASEIFLRWAEMKIIHLF